MCSEKFCKSHRKHMYRNFCFNKAAGFRAATLLRKRFRHRCFPLNFCKIFKKTYFLEQPRATASAFWRSNNWSFVMIQNGKPNLWVIYFTKGVFFWPCVCAPLQTANLFFSSYAMFYYTFYFSITLFPSWNFIYNWLVVL